ncbi:MAG: protein-glutamate O-methyltransferase CheR [Firmicutes bacterium]|nr:protein-glutamate O-methyltransferase CheR [Bacillota bacterium]
MEAREAKARACRIPWAGQDSAGSPVPAAAWDFETFAQHVYAKSGIDLRAYKRQQMQRRINSLMQSLGIEDYRIYFELLDKDRGRYEEFLRRLTINVTEFFRNPERYDDLREKILPELARNAARRGEPLKIWSAGCADGAEPYSVAMILAEMGLLRQARILATDVDVQVLERARAGVFVEFEMKNISSQRMQRFFVSGGQGRFQVVEDLRRAVEFRRHDLLQDPYESGFDLILCRNVVIYFTEDAKHSLYRRLVGALAEQGILFVGGTEPILRYREYGLDLVGQGFYRRASRVPSDAQGRRHWV